MISQEGLPIVSIAHSIISVPLWSYYIAAHFAADRQNDCMQQTCRHAMHQPIMRALL
jgi:hypothetical protein